MKLNRRKDARKVLLNKTTLKNLDPETLNLKKLWSKCKKLWNAKHILSLWVSNNSIRVNLRNEAVSIVTHDCDLANRFPDNPVIKDY